MSSNPWNDFQHDHADEGLSHADMSEMYHTEQDASESGVELTSTTDMPDTIGSVADSDSGLTIEANSDAHTEFNSINNQEDAENETYNQDEESQNSGNQWNDFQHQHQGEGKASSELSEMYHAEQESYGLEHETTLNSDANQTVVDHNDDGSIPSSNNVHANTQVDSDTSENPADDIQEPSKNESSDGNSWNDFQHQHKGEEKTSSELSDMYRKETDASSSTQQTPESSEENSENGCLSGNNSHQFSTGSEHIEGNNDNNSELQAQPQDDLICQTTTNGNIQEQEVLSSSPQNQWNKFEHEHKNQGLSQQQISALYHQQQQEQQQQQPQQQEQQPQQQQPPQQLQEQPQPPEQLQQEQQERTMNNPEEGLSQSSLNEWNKFEHEHKNQGLSPQQMSALYHQQQQEQQQQQPQQQEQQPQQQQPSQQLQQQQQPPQLQQQPQPPQQLQQQPQPPQQLQQQPQPPQQLQQEQQERAMNNPEEGLSQSSLNEWNKFEHEHKNQGLSPQQMSALYHQQQQEQQQKQPPQQLQQEQQERTMNNPEEGLSQLSLNEWNKFEHEHKNQGLSQQQMSALYHQQQQPLQQLQQQQPPQQLEQEQTMNNPEGLSQSSLNEWNKFEHEHKTQGLSPQQMSALYHQQQQEQQSQQEQQGRIMNNPQEGSIQSSPHEWNKSKYEGRNLERFSKGTVDCYNQQNQQKQKPKASVQWNLFQHIYRGKGLTRQEMSSKYNEFKENERTFYWKNDFQLVLTPDGKLNDPNSPAGQEAMKTGLFDEQNCLRRRGDLPFSIFQAKISAMGITDRSKISSMYWNMTGSAALHTANLRQDSYRQQAAVGTTRRDPDHILELQVVAPELRKTHLNEEDFHMLRCVLNGEHNIESRGVKVNRFIKRAANNGIATNNVKLTNFTFNQEAVQAKQASDLADICHQQGCAGAETVLRRLADKCNHLHSIHDQIMQLKEQTTDSNEKHERERLLIESIHKYENEHGPLNFHGSNFTEYRKNILNEAHHV